MLYGKSEIMPRIKMLATVIGALMVFVPCLPAQEKEQLDRDDIDITPPHISADRSLIYDYDIVYVRLLRDGPKPKVWAQAGVPLQMNQGADLMLLHPDGREEVLVSGGKGW